MKYVYLGTKETDPLLKGQPCDPVLDERGKCVRGRGSQLVKFADGRRIVVVARRLRLSAGTGSIRSSGTVPNTGE
jgi:hypothetical protein